MALRRSLLPTRRHRKPNKRIACVGDRPHQLQPVLGQPVPSAVDSRCLRAHAGAALACRGHRLCASSGLDVKGTLLETGGASDGLGAAHGYTPAAIVPVSCHIPTNTWLWPSGHPPDNTDLPRQKILSP